MTSPPAGAQQPLHQLVRGHPGTPAPAQPDGGGRAQQAPRLLHLRLQEVQDRQVGSAAFTCPSLTTWALAESIQ